MVRSQNFPDAYPGSIPNNAEFKWHGSRHLSTHYQTPYEQFSMHREFVPFVVRVTKGIIMKTPFRLASRCICASLGSIQPFTRGSDGIHSELNRPAINPTTSADSGSIVYKSREHPNQFGIDCVLNQSSFLSCKQGPKSLPANFKRIKHLDVRATVILREPFQPVIQITKLASLSC